MLEPLNNAPPEPNESVQTRFLAQSLMQKRKFNPFERMMDLADELEEFNETADAPTHVKERLSIYSKLAAFYAPQPKAIDINIQSDHTHTIQAVDFTTLSQQRRHLIPEPGNYNGPSLVQLTGTHENTD